MTNVEIYCDGACLGNPGPGGFGAFLLFSDHVIEIGGYQSHTTNNRMEMTAALRSLEALLDKEAQVTIYSDSQYLIKGMTEWMVGWERKGWRNAAGAAVLNQDLWLALKTEQARFQKPINWRYVKGHAGIPGNERADQIASSFACEKPLECYQGPRSSYSFV